MTNTDILDLLSEDISSRTAGELTARDLNARPLDTAERAMCNIAHSIQGYIIPYYDIFGRPKPHYRARLLGGGTLNFSQPKETPNHIYFPKKFLTTLNQNPTPKYVLVTIGELEATLCIKHGIPCIAFNEAGGWRNNPVKSEKDEGQHDSESLVAVGFGDLIDLLLEKDLTCIIVYPTSVPVSFSSLSLRTTLEHQRWAALLGYELRFKGIPFKRIKQLILPIEDANQEDEVSLTDFLVGGLNKQENLRTLIDSTLKSSRRFPLHPNIREFLNLKLQTRALNRKDLQCIAMAILSDFDGRGRRLRNVSQESYFFDYKLKSLLKVEWPLGPQYDAPFTRFLYTEYGLSQHDSRMLTWLGTQFASEEPVELVSPHRILAFPELDQTDLPEVFKTDHVFFQTSDSQYVGLTKDALRLFYNGANNILFQADQCEPLDTDLLFKEFEKQSKTDTLECWWAETLSQVRLRDKDKQRIIGALLYYMSPWLLRWKDIQLPIELIIGEAGSGKSTLCELRLEILTGRPMLRNSPNELRDWYASITSSGGLHVTDNVKLEDKGLRQKISDELCRIVTEPNPYIEQRKLYTNTEQVRVPVRSTFAITSIVQPFQNADLLQRAFVLELDKSVEQEAQGLVRYDSSWKDNQLNKRGGREAWLAHHLLVTQRLFNLAHTKWNPSYQAKQRLNNFEQTMMLLAEVFGIQNSWIPDFLVGQVERTSSEADWVLEGLLAFALQHNIPQYRTKSFPVSTISEWCLTEQDLHDNPLLTNTRRLGRYMRAHKSQIYSITGIQEVGSYGNRMVYRFTGPTKYPTLPPQFQDPPKHHPDAYLNQDP
jgi:hypothetical protein